MNEEILGVELKRFRNEPIKPNGKKIHEDVVVVIGCAR